MLGSSSGGKVPADDAATRAKIIFERMDHNNDGHLTEDEFLAGCMEDEELSRILSPLTA
jgi:hypothetical protein